MDGRGCTMKKITCYFLIMLLLLIGCASKYEGYQEVKIPDENIGSVMIPNNWEFVTEAGWIYIVDSNTNDILAFEYARGNYYWVGTQNYDERQFNPLYVDYLQKETVQDLTGNSNLSNCYILEFEIDGNTKDLLSLVFTSFDDSRYSIKFIFDSSEIDQTILINIADSYDSEIK